MRERLYGESRARQGKKFAVHVFHATLHSHHQFSVSPLTFHGHYRPSQTFRRSANERVTDVHNFFFLPIPRATPTHALVCLVFLPFNRSAGMGLVLPSPSRGPRPREPCTLYGSLGYFFRHFRIEVTGIMGCKSCMAKLASLEGDTSKSTHPTCTLDFYLFISRSLSLYIYACIGESP